MKFLMDYTGTVAVNTAFVEKIYIKDLQSNEDETDGIFTITFRDNKLQDDADKFLVLAIDNHSNEITLQKFNSDDKDKNLMAAKKYLMELVDKLNSGANL